ncbi:hypothetical protein GQ42DRAFT_122869, partial [Ramicandelaber brevisporus]
MADLENTYFRETLMRWREKNATALFASMARAVHPLCYNLTLISVNRSKIVDIIIAHLQGLEPILGLIVALAQDLESDLADDYQRLFNAVCPLVKLSDSSVVALAFDCLGSLTKSLGSALVSNMDSTLSLFAPLLGAQNQRSHIRKFAAQTLALLVRRARDGKLKEFVEAMYNLLHQTSAESAVVVKNRRSFAEGCAMLIYEAIKGVEGQLHSRAGVIYSSVLDKFITNNNNNNNNNDDDDSDSDDNEIYGHSTRLVIIVTNLILHHVDREHSSPIYTAILDAFSKTIDSAPQNMRTLTRLISLLRTSVALREGRRVPDLAPVVQSALSLYNNDTINSSNGDGVNNGSNQPPSVTASLWTEFMRQRTGLAVSTLHKCTLEQLLKSGRLLLETLAEREDPACFIALGLSLLRLKWQYSAQFLLPLLARVSDNALSSSSPAAASNTGDKLLVFWAHVIESGVVSPSALTHGGSKSSEMFVSSTVGADGLIRFPGSSDAVSGGFISHLLSVLSAPVEWSSDNSSAFSTDVDSTQRSLSPIERLSLALICVRGVFVGPRSSAFIDSLQTLLTQLQQLQQQQQQQQQSDAVPVSVIGQTISTLIDVIQRSGSKTTSILAELWKSTVSKLIIAHPNCPSIVSASATLAGLLRPTFGSSGDEDVAELFSSKAVVAILPILVPNVSSVDASLRLATLELLSHYDQLPLKSSEPGSNQEEKKSAKKSKSATARTQATITTYRDKLMALRSLSTLAAARRIPGEYIEILPRLCIAFFSINMQPIWQESIAALKVVAESHPKVVWRLIHRELLRYEPADASSSGTVQPLMISAAVRNWMHDELDAFHRETVPKPSPFLDGLALSLAGHARLLFIARHTLSGSLLDADYSASLAQVNLRLDYATIYEQLMRAMIECPHVAEQNASALVPLLFDFTDPARVHDQSRGFVPVAFVHRQAPSDPDVRTLPAPKRLTLALTLMGKFKSPTQGACAAHSQQLYEYYMELLTKPDSRIQLLALECILTWKDKSITTYAEHLRALLDEKRFRDELTTFPSASIEEAEAPTVHSEHRSGLMSVMLRLLYGRSIGKAGNVGAGSSGRKTRRSGASISGVRRIAILAKLSNLPADELRVFVDIMLAPFRHLRDNLSAEDGHELVVRKMADGDMPSARHQLGFFNYLADLIKQFGKHSQPFMGELLNVLLSLHVGAQKVLDETMDVDSADNDDDVEEEDDNDEQVRQLIVRQICALFRIPVSYNFRDLLPRIFEVAISPRLARFSVENTQAPSALMELFAVWSARPAYLSFLHEFDSRILSGIVGCLSAPQLRHTVAIEAVAITENITNISPILSGFDALLRRIPAMFASAVSNTLKAHTLQHMADQLLRRTIRILSAIAEHVTDASLAHRLLALLLPLTRKPTRTVPEQTKAHILEIFTGFQQQQPVLSAGSALFTEYYGIISRLFAQLASAPARQALVNSLTALVQVDSASIKHVAHLVSELNSYSVARISEPDYDRRLKMFSVIIDSEWQTLSPIEWLPLLHNFVFFMSDSDEMALQRVASASMNRFAERVAHTTSAQPSGGDDVVKQLVDLLMNLVIAAIEHAAKNRTSTVRSEFVQLYGYIVKTCPHVDARIAELVPLLGSDPSNNTVISETSFFSNILHLQIHRRSRAMRRFRMNMMLSIRSKSILNFFIPLLTHFVFETLDDVSGAKQDPANEAVATIGVLCRSVPWARYLSTLRGFIKMVDKKPELERLMVKLVISILDNFSFDVTSATTGTAASIAEDTTEDAENDGDDDTNEVERAVASAASAANIAADSGVAQAERIVNTIISVIVPDLKKILSSGLNTINNDDTTIAVRIPIGFSLVKLLRALTTETLRLQLPGVLTLLCNILRSRRIDVRSATRDTLVKIAKHLGPAYVQFIVKEMQSALTQGYQLHVLGYSAYTLLHMCHTGDLDYCLPDLVELFIQDIFGAIGSEKESADWVGKMKESKAKKGYDAFGLLARVTPVPSLGTLLLPLREILTETESPRTTKKVDKVLSQVQYGVMAAADFTNAGTMSLCKDILVQSVRISQNTGKKQSAAANSLAKSRLEAARRANDAKHTVMMKRSDVLGRQDYFPQNAYRFTAFALGLLQMSLKQNRLVRSDESHIALVDPVVAEVAEALYLPHQNLVASAISIFTMLCRWPLPAIARAIPGLLHRVLQHLRAFSGTSGSGSSATGTDMSERGELVQSCVALLNTILRNSDLQVDVSSSQLEFLINLARVNLEEPERQFTMFALVKSILTRRFMSEQLYDLMTSISQLMITSQDVGVRSTCRQLYFQFLMDYPQSEQRLKNQILFVVKQLEYVHESGRQSAMEMLHLIITKFSEDVLAQFVDLVFMGLVLSLINDESKKCREMTATLIKLLVSKMQSAKLEATFTMLEAWFDSPSKKLTMRRAAMQIYGLVVESLGDQFRRQVPALLERIHSALRISYDDWKDAEQRKLAQLSQPTTAVAFFADSGPVASTDDVDVSDWELGYFALQTFGKLINQFGDLTLTSSDSNGAYTAQRELAGLVWRLVIEMLPHPYEWVRLSTCRLLGILFA